MSGPFESYDDLDDADERLHAPDPGERRVAVIALGHSGDPAAVSHLAGLVSTPMLACASKWPLHSVNSMVRKQLLH